MTSYVCFRVAGPKIVHEVFDEEIVIINLDTGTYYSIQDVAAEVWRRIESETLQDIVDDLTSRYGEEREVGPLVTRYLDELQREGLIVPAPALATGIAEGRRRAAAQARTAHGPFQAPVLHKFDDMQELLLLDPIHDFDDAGWPIAKPAEPLEK